MNEIFKEKLKELVKQSTPTGFMILVLLWIPFSFINDEIQDNIGENTKRIVREIIKEELMEIRTSIDEINVYIYGQKIRNIEKQADKILNDPDDIKSVDVQVAINDWNIIPEKYKNPLLIDKFNIVKEWATAHL